ncbi:MAG: hypothetical protein K2L55_01110 [Muribaculaceae bacterium]|nr:hypothetical protein [Muribaculaceae bacterium]
MDKTDNKPTKEEREKAERQYPGAAVNEADNNADNKQLVKERTCELNNNPRNEGKPV